MEPDQHGESHVVSWAILFRIGPATREGVAKRPVIKTKEVLRSVDQIWSSSSLFFRTRAVKKVGRTKDLGGLLRSCVEHWCHVVSYLHWMWL